MLSKGQEFFLSTVKAGENAFLTGKAGTGKSYVVKEAMRILKEAGKKVAAIAPTGVAANNVGGATIHSLFALPVFGVCKYEFCAYLKSEKRELLKAIDCFFIDEVSMLRPDILDGIHWTLLKNGCEGGLTSKQVVFVGDLKQLPAPINDNMRSVLFMDYNGEEFYNSFIYSKLNVKDVELQDVLRQSDEAFISALNTVREGNKSEYFRQFVGTEKKGIILAPHNSTVERYNIDGLAQINEPEIIFNAKVTGNVKATDFNVDEVIKVKQGAKIMYLANSKDAPLVNGTIGQFITCEGCYYIRVGNVDYALKTMEFTKKEYVLNKDKSALELQELGKIEQYPFKLAYALSIHKSQGLTFDEVTVDLSRPCFAKGQMYVALSRVTSPNGLRILI